MWLAALGSLVATTAAAQINPFGNNPGAFAREDRRRMFESMRDVLESGGVGETAAWTSEDGTFGGVSELRRTYSRDGMRCGELRHRFVGRAGDAGVYEIQACDVPGEGWKFAF
jgi:surface antigen